MIPAVLALVVIAAVVCVAVYTGVLGDVRNRALRFFPIHSVEDIKRDDRGRPAGCNGPAD